MGDCNGRGAFTHTSWNDHEVLLDRWFGDDTRSLASRIPCYALFIDPPLARVGLNEAQARATGRPLLRAKMSMQRVGRACRMPRTPVSHRPPPRAALRRCQGRCTSEGCALIDLHTAATPNGHKVSVALEELALPYAVTAVDLAGGAQKTEAFRRLNPNGRIPVIVDHAPLPGRGGAGPFTVFESGAILLYLAEKTGRLMPADAQGRSLVTQWLMFQMGGIGPMMGQANVFFRYLPEKIPLAIERYQNESRRLFEVLDRRLGEAQWLAGSDYSIADIANWCWVRTYKWSGVNIENLPHLRRWLDAMKARPACQRGIEVPMKVPSALKDEQATQAFIERARHNVQR